LNIKHHELASRVRHFEQLLSSRADNFHELAGELYELLLKPAEDQIALKTRLVIVPDGLLWRLPFEALQPAEDHYLVDQAQVSYAPSLSALREMQKLRLPAKRLNSLLVAYANPELSKNFATRFELVHAGIKLESFAGQEEQIKRIATSYGPTTSLLQVGAQASEERIKGDMSRANILHFAGPTILDDASPMSSFIGLSSAPSSATGQPASATSQPSSATRQDGFLQSRELMDLQSTAELVVAPTTRHTAAFTGDAAVGFSWSWFVAGTRASLVSRWPVESPALSTLMTGFYSSIKPATRTPVSKSRALHQNVLALRRSPNHQHPYYWATFALIGDAR
jgi:CHAT domain-containing protein